VTERPTRWQRAKRDSRGFLDVRRDLSGAVVTGALAVLALLLFGSPGDAVPAEAIVGGAAILGAILTPVFELLWHYLRAPTRMLREDVAAIRERVDLSASGSPDVGVEERQRALRRAVGGMLEELELAERCLVLSMRGEEREQSDWPDEITAWFDGRDVLAESGYRNAYDAARLAYLMLDGPEADGEKLRVIREALALLNPLLEGEA
jgi:hypothetical protein